MQTTPQKRDRLFVGLVAAMAVLTLLRLAMSGLIELLPEEAYYWTYMKHPSLGYFDHPPMVAWVIRCGTMLLGDTEPGVRLGCILLAVGTGWLLVRTAELWFNRRVAAVAGWMFVLAPVFVGMGFLGMPDGPLLFFWMLTLYALTRALQEGRTVFWLLAGVAFGGALLSKYYALLLAPSLLVFLVMSPKYRSWLRRPQPWVAVVLALVVFSPPVIWNMQHQWASFAFQSTRTVGQRSSGVMQFLWFWVAQVLLPTPALFALFVLAAVRGVRRGWGRDRADNWNFAVAFALPLIALFALASTKGAFRMNWTAPAFLSLLPAAAATLLEALDGGSALRARRWRWAARGTVGLCVLIIVVGHLGLATTKLKWLSYVRLGGWRQLAKQVAVEQAALAEATGQKPFVLGIDKYNLAAELGFYLRNPQDCVNPFALGAQGLGYRYWTDLERLTGCPAVILLPRADERNLNKVRPHFAKLDPPKLVRITVAGRVQRELYLVAGYGYRPHEAPIAE